MLQLDTKTILAFKSVKNDPKLSDLVGRIDKNITNLGTLSSKAFKYLTKMEKVKDDDDNHEVLFKTYEALSVYANKMQMCSDIQVNLSE